MRIVSLEVENIKKIVAVRINPKGNLITISGKNAQGKSSVLDAIAWAMMGKRSIQQEPIRNGETTARIQLDLGEIIVTRKFKKLDDGSWDSTISVMAADGAKFKSPDAVLKSLIGELSFDPIAFTRISPAEQLDQLKKLVPGVDFGALAAANKADFERRTLINTNAKSARARAAGIEIPASVPAVRVDETALANKLREAGEHNASVAERKARREAAQREYDNLIAQIASLQNRANDLKAKLDGAEPLPEPVNVTALTAELTAARAANSALDRLDERKRLEAEADALEEQSAALTAAIEKRNAEKRAAIETAELPVPGLDLGEDGVLLNGVPFGQASSSEQVRAAVAIGAALNPKLRVIACKDGSLLDEDALKILEDFAEKNDFQIWIERVAGEKPVGFEIAEGVVRSTPESRGAA